MQVCTYPLFPSCFASNPSAVSQKFDIEGKGVLFYGLTFGRRSRNRFCGLKLGIFAHSFCYLGIFGAIRRAPLWGFEKKPSTTLELLGTMHTRIACVTQCEGIITIAAAASSPFPSSSPSSLTIIPRISSNNDRQRKHSEVAGAGSPFNSTLRIAAENIARGVNDSSNVARVGSSGSEKNRKRGIEGSTTLATLQESVTVLEHDAVNGASTLREEEEQQRNEQHPSDYIGYGSLLEKRSLFRERFVIRFSEAGPRGTITVETLTSLLQEAATNHVIVMDYAFSPGKNSNGNITVITRMHIEVDKYPAWRDLLEIDTWFQPEGKNSVRRDWIVKDVKTGQEIAFATSTWVLMNTSTRRLTKITDERWAELEPHMRYPPKWALSEERRNLSSTKISKLGNDSAFNIPGLMASEKDCDMNQHVNNIRYMSWMLESIPEEVKNSHEVSKITLEYRQEASLGEVVESLAEPEEELSSSMRKFTHLIKTSPLGKEINRGRTVWRPIQ